MSTMKSFCFVVVLLSCGWAQEVCDDCLEDIPSRLDHFLEEFPHALEQVIDGVCKDCLEDISERAEVLAEGPFPGSPYTAEEEAAFGHQVELEVEHIVEDDVKADLHLDEPKPAAAAAPSIADGPFPGSPFTADEEAQIAHDFQIEIEHEIEQDVEADLAPKATKHDPLPGSPFSAADEAAIEDALQKKIKHDTEMIIEEDLTAKKA